MLYFSKVFYNRVVITMAILVLSATAMFAQHPISNALTRLMETGNFREANDSISKYSSSELAVLPDSTLFDYYYLKAAIKDNEGKDNEKRAYLIEAKKLCEKSQGIHSPVYLEICWAIGKSFEENGNILSAFDIYLVTLIQSIGLYSLNDEDVKWQYEEINDKVIAWYKNDTLRNSMIKHRSELLPRDVSNKVIQQNDIEFYEQYYNNESAVSLISKADSLNTISSWREAANLYIKVANTTHDNPIAKATLQELAAINYINMEELQSAESLLLNNLQLLESNKNSKVYRRTLSKLATLYNAIHNYSKAKDYAGAAKYYFEEALDFGLGYIQCLHRCSMLEFGNENYWLALLLEDAALQELYRHQTWSVIPGLSRNEFLADLLSAAGLYYNQIGLHYKQAGFRYDAYTNIETAIEIAEANNIDACTYYKNLVDLCVASYDFDKALLAGDKAYRLSESDNNKTTFCTTLCLCQFLAHKPISSEIIVESSKSLQSLINRIFSFTSMDERKNFWSNYELYFPMLNLFAYKSGNTKLYGQICNNILVEKGLLLRTANSLRNQILETGNTEDIQSYDHLLQLRKLLPTLSHNESQSVNSEIDRIDKHLTQKFASYANFTSSFNLTWNNIQEHLNDEDIAIEFYNIPETTWHKDCKDVDGKVRYCAITLRKGYTIPHIIPLFTEERLQSIEQEDLYETDSVYNLIWKPLEEELRGVRNIYFAADRELHKIGIEYAPMPNGSIIGDKYSMYRLSSTRVIVENRAEKRSENAVLYGGLRYDIGKNELVAESRSGNYHPTSALRAFTSESNRFGVKYLPGTLKEVEEISRSFNNKPRLITDINGTEESFKSLAGSPVDIIHLATHGFFWSEDDAKKRNYVSFLSNMQNLKSDEDKALTRSGLFFSGANLGLRGESLPDDVEDGVLTALELSNMNLGHVDMVVMSACESGLGETTGEGVFGLQRGFKLAGANTLLMSLWKVDDTATQLLMTNFYKNYLAGKSKQESLKLAQRTLRKNSEYSAPEYWAAFILLDGLN